MILLSRNCKSTIESVNVLNTLGTNCFDIITIESLLILIPTFNNIFERVNIRYVSIYALIG